MKKANNISEISKMMKKMDKAFKHGLMAESLKATGRTEISIKGLT